MSLLKMEDNLFSFNVKIFARFGRWCGSDNNPKRLLLLFVLGAALVGALIPGIIYAEKETDIGELCTFRPGEKRRRGDKREMETERRKAKLLVAEIEALSHCAVYKSHNATLYRHNYTERN